MKMRIECKYIYTTVVCCALMQFKTSAYNVFSLHNAKEKIILEVQLNENGFKPSGHSQFSPVEYIGERIWKHEQKSSERGIVKWVIESDEPCYLDFSSLLTDRRNGFWLVEPGDRVKIVADGTSLRFSGHGSEKYRLQYQLDSLVHKIERPTNKRDFVTYSTEDYFEWDSYFDKKLNFALPLIEGYKDEISKYAFDLLRANYIDQIIDDRSDKFRSLRKYLKENQLPLSTLCSIYDTSYSKKVDKWLEYTSSIKFGNLSPISERIYRRYSFSERPSDIEQLNLYMAEVTKLYGNTPKRQKFLIGIIPGYLKEMGFTPELTALLDEYYLEPGFPEYKIFMKKEEIKIRERMMAGKIPDFRIIDQDGVFHSKKNISGKYVILNFSTENKSLGNPALLKKFENDSRVKIIDIRTDLNEGNNVFRDFAVAEFPTTWIIHPDGRVLNSYPKVDISKDNFKMAYEIIAKYRSYSKDGPYFFHRPSGYTSYYIQDSTLITLNNPQKLSVHTDLNKTFSVSLKKSLAIEPSTYAKPQKLIALSDIEGNFDAFRKLLQANKIIDENFNWIFGNGHLVFAGDMFDRGNQVTECLWLLYSMEEKAKNGGGYVHFVLGNHEIMNLQGDHKYVENKYKDNAKLMGKTLTELYNENSELGRWLRTKNIIETIGDLLFVHGGISHQVWRMPLTVPEINNLARPYYAETKIDTNNKYLKIIYGSRRTGPEKAYSSPFWFRGYYGDIDNPYEIPTMKQLDSALNKYNVRKIITGHTIIADTISVHYDGKVINTDTRHASGKSEALLIEGNKFYRVNTEGKKVLLFTDDKRKVSDK